MTLRHIKNNIAFSSACRHFAVKSLSVLFVLFALALTSVTLVSCSDLLSPVNPIERPDNPNLSTNPASSETSEIVISGSINRNESNGAGAYPSVLVSSESDDSVSQNASGLGRMALPSLNMANAAYYVIAKTGQTEREGTVNETQHTFSIPLSLGSAWTIELGMYIPDFPGGERTDENTKFKGTYTYDHPLTADDVNTPVSIKLFPMQNGNGHIALNISAASGLNVDVDVISEPVAGTWNAAVGNNPDFSSGINISSIKSGTYRLKLVFTDSESNQEVYYSEQDVNVYDNMTTNTWVGDSSSNSPVIGTPSSGNYFTVDSSLINAYRLTTFYVGGTGASDTNGDGTSYAPFETVSKALTVIGYGATGTDYVIWLKSGIQERVLINNLTSGTLTIKGYGANRTITNNVTNSSDISNYTVKVSSTNAVTLENITIDGAVTYPTGTGVTMGLVASSGTNVTLKNCTITKTNRDNGSAVWGKGTVTLEDCTITHCRSTDVTDTDSSYLIVNSEHGVLNLKNCTISKNTARCIVYNVSSAEKLKLDGNISIPVEKSQSNETPSYEQKVSIKLAGDSTGSKITIGDAFTCNGSILLELPDTNGTPLYTNGSTVLVPETNGATSVVASAASKFTLDDASYSIGTTGDNIGKLVLNPNIYVADSTHGGSFGGNGSEASPYRTIGDAVNKILDLNTAADYVIHVTGTLNCPVYLDNTTLGTFSGSTLTIKGTDNSSDILDGNNLHDASGDSVNYLIYINHTRPINFENLTIQHLTSDTYAAVHIDNTSANVTITNCDIKNNRIGVIVNNGNVTVEGCSITDNINNASSGYGGGIYNAGTLTLKSNGSSACNIAGNKVNASGYGGGVYNTGTLNIQGEVSIKNNMCGTDTTYTDDNLYLKSGTSYVINVTGEINSKSEIHVTTQARPDLDTPVVITSGLGTNGGSNVSANNFKSDNNWTVYQDPTSSEIKFGVSGGGISTVLDYNVALSCSATSFTYGSSITVSATVTKNGVAVSPAANDITWGAMLLCYGDQAVSLSGSNVSASAGSVTITIPGSSVWTIFNGLPYTLHVTAVYKDVGKDINVDLTGTVN